jgi:hypothetical protein
MVDLRGEAVDLNPLVVDRRPERVWATWPSIRFRVAAGTSGRSMSRSSAWMSGWRVSANFICIVPASRDRRSVAVD